MPPERLFQRQVVVALHRLEDRLESPEPLFDLKRRKMIRYGVVVTSLTALGALIGFAEWSRKISLESLETEETPSWQKEPKVISFIKEAEENGIIPVQTGHLLEMDNIVLINNTSHLLIGLNSQGSSLLLDDPRLIKAKTFRASGNKIIFMFSEEGSSPFPNLPKGWMVELRAGKNSIELEKYFLRLKNAKKEGITGKQILKDMALSDSREFSAHIAARLVHFCQTGETGNIPPELLNEFMSKPLDTIFPVYFLAYDESWLNQP